jgi:hypothetical protein
MGGTAIEVDVLPAQAAQFPLAHGGLQRQLHHRQQPAIARLAPAGDVNSTDTGDETAGEGMTHPPSLYDMLTQSMHNAATVGHRIVHRI